MIVLLAALLASSHAEIAQITIPADRSTPRPKATSAAVAPAVRALAFYESVRTNAIDRALLTSAFAAELTPEAAQVIATALRGLGTPTEFVARARHAIDGATIYDFTATLPGGTIAVTLGIDDATDRISRFYVRRASAPA